MPRAPFGAGPPHIMKLGSIGIEDALDELLASRIDSVEPAVERPGATKIDAGHGYRVLLSGAYLGHTSKDGHFGRF
jgi:hypothetical protein